MEYREGDESYGEQRERTEKTVRREKKFGKMKGNEEKKVYIIGQNKLKKMGEE